MEISTESICTFTLIAPRIVTQFPSACNYMLAAWCAQLAKQRARSGGIDLRTGTTFPSTGKLSEEPAHVSFVAPGYFRMDCNLLLSHFTLLSTIQMFFLRNTKQNVVKQVFLFY